MITKKDMNIVRKGVNDTKNSFLECIMEGMYEETRDIINIHKSKLKA